MNNTNPAPDSRPKCSQEQREQCPLNSGRCLCEALRRERQGPHSGQGMDSILRRLQ